MQIQIFIFNLI